MTGQHGRAPVGARHPEEDLLVELALGQVPEPSLGEVTGHLAGCLQCRRRYDERAGAVDLVLPAVPRVAPPAGFVTGVLDRIEAERATLATTTTATTAAARPSRRQLLWAVAAGVVGLAAGAGVASSLLRDDDASSPWAAPLVAGGRTVGSVSRSYGSDGSMLVVDLGRAETEGEWTCLLRMRDGSTRDVGTWRLGAGSPRSWIVTDPGPELEAVELVRADGTVWARAQL